MIRDLVDLVMEHYPDAMAEMYVQGVSTRKVTAIVEELCGLEVTSTQVSRAAAELDEQLDAWRNRPIGEITYLVLNTRSEKIHHDGAFRSCALLTAIGIDTDGKRGVLGCSMQLSEAEPHWPMTTRLPAPLGGRAEAHSEHVLTHRFC